MRLQTEDSLITYSSKTATADRYTGELIWLHGDLFRITRPMLAGDQYIESSEGVTGNIEKVTLEEWINRSLVYIKAAITLNDQKYNVIASKPFKSGELLWWKGNLYRAKKFIVLNEYLSTDVNLETINLEQIIKDIDTRLSDDERYPIYYPAEERMKFKGRVSYLLPGRRENEIQGQCRRKPDYQNYG